MRDVILTSMCSTGVLQGARRCSREHLVNLWLIIRVVYYRHRKVWLYRRYIGMKISIRMGIHRYVARPYFQRPKREQKRKYTLLVRATCYKLAAHPWHYQNFCMLFQSFLLTSIPPKLHHFRGDPIRNFITPLFTSFITWCLFLFLFFIIYYITLVSFPMPRNPSWHYFRKLMQFSLSLTIFIQI